MKKKTNLSIFRIASISLWIILSLLFLARIILGKDTFLGFISVQFLALFVAILTFVVGCIALFELFFIGKRLTIMEAIKSYDSQKLQYALRFNKLKINEVDKTTQLTPLGYAIANRFPQDIIQMLITNGAIIDPYRKIDWNMDSILWQLFLHYKQLSLGVVASSIRRGADVNSVWNLQDGRVCSLIQVAILQGNNPNLIMLLIRAGANLSYKEPKEGMTPLMYASKYSKDSKIINILLSAGSDIDAKNKNGANSLLIASEYNSNPDIVETLVNAGASIVESAVKLNGSVLQTVTPLRLAVQNNILPVIKKLVEVGDNINFKDEVDSSLLFVAASFNTDPMVILYLVEKGLNINEVNIFRATPLMAAICYNENINVIMALINCNADPDIISHTQKKALDFIKDNRNLSEEEKNYIGSVIKARKEHAIRVQGELNQKAQQENVEKQIEEAKRHSKQVPYALNDIPKNYLNPNIEDLKTNHITIQDTPLQENENTKKDDIGINLIYKKVDNKNQNTGTSSSYVDSPVLTASEIFEEKNTSKKQNIWISALLKDDIKPEKDTQNKKSFLYNMIKGTEK